MTPEQRQRKNVEEIKKWQAAQREWQLSQKGRRDPERELLDQRRRALVAGRVDADGVKRGLNLSQIPENGGRHQALSQRMKSLTGPMYPDGRMTQPSDINGGPGLLRDSPAPRDIPRPYFGNSIPYSGGINRKDGSVTTPESWRAQPISLTGGLNRLGSETGLAPQAQPNLSNTPVAPPVDNEFAYIEDGLELPSGVLKALMMAESGGDVNARSSKGALGAFQLMPKTAEDHGANPFNLHEAAMAAGNELKWQLRSHKGDLDKALASYNYGHGNVRKRGSNLQAIDKYQRKQTGRSETTEHRERFHQYFDKPVQPPMQPLQQDVQVPQKGISAMPKPSFIPKGISAMPKPDAAYRQSQQQPMQSLSAQDLFNRQFQQDVQPTPPMQMMEPQMQMAPRDNLLRGQTEQVKSKRKALQEEEAKYYKDNPQSTLTLTSTEWTTPFGMPVYTDQHGQRHSESSETIRFANDKWGAVPMIWPDPKTGKARYFTPQETQALVEANNYINPVSGEPIALFGSEPEATNAAIDRDLILRDKNHPWNQPTQQPIQEPAYGRSGGIYSPQQMRQMSLYSQSLANKQGLGLGNQ